MFIEKSSNFKMVSNTNQDNEDSDDVTIDSNDVTIVSEKNDTKSSLENGGESSKNAMDIDLDLDDDIQQLAKNIQDDSGSDSDVLVIDMQDETPKKIKETSITPSSSKRKRTPSLKFSENADEKPAKASR